MRLKRMHIHLACDRMGVEDGEEGKRAGVEMDICRHSYCDQWFLDDDDDDDADIYDIDRVQTSLLGPPQRVDAVATI